MTHRDLPPGQPVPAPTQLREMIPQPPPIPRVRTDNPVRQPRKRIQISRPDQPIRQFMHMFQNLGQPNRIKV
ncbi:hypothetical protein NS14008_17510 [Nocardia seriolae]|nr:hypothetical protein NS14008_17510 [Nocardia seriolae]